MLVSSAVGIDYNRPHRKWYRSETTHFNVTYLSGLQEQALLGTAIAEEVYGYFKNDYGFELPKKMEIIFDDEDYSNGWAWASANTIKIWVSGLDFENRGFNNWLRNVVVHEFAHIVSIQAGQKTRYNIPDIRFGYMDYFNERVQTGFFTLYSFDIFPMWFAEGIAQLEASRKGSDSWDTHRDMLMRTKALNNQLLPLTQMNMFVGRSKDFEGGPYNQGFSMVRYIAEKYGYESIRKICDECRKLKNISFNMALKSAIGIGVDSLYCEWSDYEKEKYRQVATRLGSPVEGVRLANDSVVNFGFRNLYPRWSDNGNALYFLSNTGRDGGRATLHKWDFSDTIKEEKKRFSPVWPFINGLYTLVDSAKRVVSARAGENPVTGETYVDAAVDSIVGLSMQDNISLAINPYKKGSKENRVTSYVTYRDHIQQASASNNGKYIAAVRKVKNKHELVLVSNENIRVHAKGNYLSQLLLGVERNRIVKRNGEKVLFRDSKKESDGFLVFNPRFSPDDSLIVFSFFDGRSMDIGMVDLNGNFSKLVISDADDRDPDFTPDGNGVVFSSDRSGIFNIYKLDLSTNNIERLTNVVGGAFQPAVSPDGKRLAFTNYDSSGFTIYISENVSVNVDSLPVLQKEVNDILKPINSISFSQEPVPYRGVLNRVLFIPMVIGEELTSSTLDADKGKFGIKGGGMLWLSDPLEKHSLIALGLLEISKGIDMVGADYGRHLFFNPSYDKEVMLLYENKSFYPTLSLSLAKFLISDTGSFYNSSSFRYEKDKYLIDVQDYSAEAALPVLSPARTLRLGVRYAQQSVDFYDLDGYAFKYSFYRTLNPYAQFVSSTFGGSGMKPWRQEDAIDPRGSTLRVRYEYSGDQILVDGSSWQESFTIGDGGKIIEKFNKTRHNRLTISYGTSFAMPFIPVITAGAEAVVSAADRPIDKFVYPGIFMNTIPFLENSSRLTFEGRNTGKAAAFLRFPIMRRIRKGTGRILVDKLYGSVFAEAGAATGLDPKWQGRSDLSEYSQQGRQFESYVARLPQDANNSRVPVEFSSYAEMQDSINRVEAGKPGYTFPESDKHTVYSMLSEDTVNGLFQNMKTLFGANVQTGFGAEIRLENYILPGYPFFVTMRYAARINSEEKFKSLERYFTSAPWNNPDGLFYVNAGFSFDSWITDRDPEYAIRARSSRVKTIFR